MRKQAWAFLLVGFIIGFGALYTWTKKRAPDIVRATPLPVESLGPAGSVPSQAPEEPPPPPLDTARLQQLETEIKNNPKNIEALIELGGLHFDQKNYPKAIDLYKRVLELQPSNVEVSNAIGSTRRLLNSRRPWRCNRTIHGRCSTWVSHSCMEGTTRRERFKPGKSLFRTIRIFHRSTW